MDVIRHTNTFSAINPTTKNTVFSPMVYDIYYMMEYCTPQLIEPGIYTYLRHSLRESYLFKWKYYNYIINTVLCLFGIIFICIFCYCHYKGTPTVEAQQLKNNKTQQYILDKINNYRNYKQKQHQELITSLPSF